MAWSVSAALTPRRAATVCRLRRPVRASSRLSAGCGNTMIAVVEALRAAVSGGATIVVATHDPHVVAAADDVIRLDHGRRVE